MDSIINWFKGIIDWLAYQFEITFITDNRYMWFVKGLGNTLIIVLGASVIGIIIGILVAIVKVSNSQNGKLKFLNRICNIYLAIFRGTPIVVQLLIMYYIIFRAIDNGIIIAIFAFGINSGAYVAEIVRAGIMSIDPGQTEAGYSLGLTYSKTMTKIILPQAIKNILPALGNEFIALLKETSIVGYISILDLSTAGDYVRNRTLEPYFSLIFIAIVYFVMVYGFTKLLKILEKRLRKSDRN